MKTAADIQIGNKVKFKTFAYTNTAGGTGTADPNPITELDILFMGLAEGRVVHKFFDYECGWRFHVELCERDWARIKDVAQENKAFVSEFDLV